MFLSCCVSGLKFMKLVAKRNIFNSTLATAVVYSISVKPISVISEVKV